MKEEVKKGSIEAKDKLTHHITPEAVFDAFHATIRMYRDEWPDLLDEKMGHSDKDLVNTWASLFYSCDYGGSDDPEKNFEMDAVEETLHMRGITCDYGCAWKLCREWDDICKAEHPECDCDGHPVYDMQKNLQIDANTDFGNLENYKNYFRKSLAKIVHDAEILSRHPDPTEQKRCLRGIKNYAIELDTFLEVVDDLKWKTLADDMDGA